MCNYTRLFTTFLQSYKNKKTLLFNSKSMSWVQFEGGHEKWEPLNILCNKVWYSLSSQGHPCSFQQNNAETRRVSATPQHCVETVWEVPSPAWKCGTLDSTETPGFHTATQLYLSAINLQLHPGLSILYQKKAGIGSNGAEWRLRCWEKKSGWMDELYQ